MKRTILLFLGIFILTLSSHAFTNSTIISSTNGTKTKSYTINKVQTIYFVMTVKGYLEYGLMGKAQYHIYSSANELITRGQEVGKRTGGKTIIKEAYAYQETYNKKFYIMVLEATAERKTVDGVTYIAKASISASW